MALLPFASNHNYDTSLLDIGKKNSDINTNDEVDSNSVTKEEQNVPVDESESNELEDKDLISKDKENIPSQEIENKDSVDNEVVSDEHIEDSQTEDKEKSS